MKLTHANDATGGRLQIGMPGRLRIGMHGRLRRNPHKIEQASRIASRLNDPTTVQRLTIWITDLKQRLQKRLDARRSKEKIRIRAYEIWEQNGHPAGRDEEFWLQAEKELIEGNKTGR